MQSSIVGCIFSKAITTPIIKLSATINEIEANSDLTKRVDIDSSDEIGLAVSSLNAMMNKIHKGIL